MKKLLTSPMTVALAVIFAVTAICAYSTMDVVTTEVPNAKSVPTLLVNKVRTIVNTSTSPANKLTVSESESKIEKRLADLGWTLKDGAVINTTDAVQFAPSSKN